MSFPDIRMSRLTLTTAAAVAAIAVAGAAAAQSMVVRSTGPSATQYPTGTKFKAGERVTLVAGDRLVLIQDGKTRTLTGAGTFNTSAPVQMSQSMGTTVTRMIAKRPPTQSRGGFTRGPDEEAPAIVRAPNLWLLDYREGGTFCVADPATLLLWRPDASADTMVRVEGAGKAGSTELKKDAQFKRWPAEVPLQYDIDYRFSGGGLAAPVTVRFALLEAMPETPEASADMLVAKGCSPQLDRLVDAMSAEENATG